MVSSAKLRPPLGHLESQFRPPKPAGRIPRRESTHLGYGACPGISRVTKQQSHQTTIFAALFSLEDVRGQYIRNYLGREALGELTERLLGVIINSHEETIPNSAMNQLGARY